jgi:hypothetical protein
VTDSEIAEEEDPFELLTYSLYMMLIAPDKERADSASKLSFEIAVEHGFLPIEVELCAINAKAWVSPAIDSGSEL